MGRGVALDGHSSSWFLEWHTCYIAIVWVRGPTVGRASLVRCNCSCKDCHTCDPLCKVHGCWLVTLELIRTGSPSSSQCRIYSGSPVHNAIPMLEDLQMFLSAQQMLPYHPDIRETDIQCYTRREPLDETISSRVCEDRQFSDTYATGGS
jgi:hypothetical protein